MTVADNQNLFRTEYELEMEAWLRRRFRTVCVWYLILGAGVLLFRLVFYMLSGQEGKWTAVLITLAQGFTAVISLSRPDPGWPGEAGRVHRLIEERVQSVKNLAVYLCGNSGMIAEVTALIRKKGLCPIYREQYYDDRDSPEE